MPSAPQTRSSAACRAADEDKPDAAPNRENARASELLAANLAQSDAASPLPADAAPSQSHGTTLQDTFLNGLRREKIDTVIYFSDGSQERGTVRAFDTFTILLEHRASGKTQLVYKHAVARIFPTRAPTLFPTSKSSPPKP